MNEDERDTIKGFIALGVIFISIQGWYIFLPMLIIWLLLYLLVDTVKTKFKEYKHKRKNRNEQRTRTTGKRIYS